MRPRPRIITTRDRAFLEAQKIRGALEKGGPWRLPRGGKRHISEAIQDGAWTGSRCFLVGGGPSLRGFDFSRIRGEKTIAINAAFIDAPWADIMFSMDMSFFRMLKTGQLGPQALPAFQEFKGIKCFLEIDNHNYPAPIHYVVGFVAYRGLPRNLKAGFWTGANSGFGALMLAFCLGASPIYLLGFDMRHAAGRSHYHGRYRRKQSPKQLERFVGAFNRIAPAIAASGREVVNLSPESALKCFPKKTLEEVLDGKKIDDVGPSAEAAGRLEGGDPREIDRPDAL